MVWLLLVLTILVDDVEVKADINQAKIHDLTKAGGTLEQRKSDLIVNIDAVHSKTEFNVTCALTQARV